MKSKLEAISEKRFSEDTAFSVLKRKLQKVIAETSAEILVPLMDIISCMNFDISSPPELGMLMMNIQEFDGNVFHLGEVLVTQAQVVRGESTGFGCVIGDNPEAALAMACLDALSCLKSEILSEKLIMEEIERIYESVVTRRTMQAHLTALTKVDFRSMAEE